MMFVETPETSERMTIQIDEEVPESDRSPMDIEGRNSEVENLVAKDNNVGKSGTTETTVEDAPIQLHRSTRVKHTPTQDDDPRYSVMSYSRQKVSGESEEPQNTVLVMKDPVTYEEAMSRNDAVYWKKVCAEELEAFVKQELFSTVLKPVGCKVIGCKWVFKTKLDEDGQVERYKAWLVAQGFSQIPGIDFDETFAPVTHHQMLRTLLTLANRYCWHIHQMDVKSAFLNGDLENEIFMRIPPGVEAKEEQVWLLHKVLYGLKQASREWYLKLKGQLEELGFKRSDADHRVFIKIIDGKLFVIAIYVDDFLLFSSNISHIRTVKEDLKRRFEMKDLGKAKWILQMKIERIVRATRAEHSRRFLRELDEAPGGNNLQYIY